MLGVVVFVAVKMTLAGLKQMSASFKLDSHLYSLIHVHTLQELVSVILY